MGVVPKHYVDGTDVASEKFEHTMPFAFESSETFDVGSDTGTAVNGEGYKIPFALTGKLNRLTFELGQPKLTPPGGP